MIDQLSLEQKVEELEISRLIVDQQVSISNTYNNSYQKTNKKNKQMKKISKIYKKGIIK